TGAASRPYHAKTRRSSRSTPGQKKGADSHQRQPFPPRALTGERHQVILLLFFFGLVLGFFPSFRGSLLPIGPRGRHLGLVELAVPVLVVFGNEFLALGFLCLALGFLVFPHGFLFGIVQLAIMIFVVLLE